ncbi:MAG: DUF2147 domain-containing protein [Gallionella sp.]
MTFAMFYRVAPIFFLMSFFAPLACAAHLTGLWQEYNDDTGKVEALIRIEKMPDSSYEGRIEKLLPDVPENTAMTCKQCSGELRGRPLLGLRILSGMKRKDALVLDDGIITDPDDGKTYQCHIRISEDGNSLEVTGYLTFNWIGHSEIWRRAK